MRKKILVMLAGLMLSASLALASSPSAPVLSFVNTKIADGNGYTDGGPTFVFDGLKTYSVYKTAEGVIKLVKSVDGGATWGGAHRIAMPVGNVNGVTLAVSGDATVPSQKIVHVVWEMDTEIGRDIMYTWADASNLDSWSDPIRANGSLTYLQDPTIAVTKSGKIYIKGQLEDQYFLMVSSAHDAGFFTEPSQIPISATFRNPNSDSEIFIDSANNLHLSFPYCSNTDCSTMGMKYTRMSSDGTWSNPVTITTTGGGHSGIAAYDANNVCIGSIGGGNLSAYCTKNGGSSWNKKTLSPRTATQRYGSYVDVAVNSNKVFTVGSNLYAIASDGSETKSSTVLYRTNDGGASWSTATAFPAAGGGGFIALGVDGNGKLGVLTERDSVDGEPATYFSKEK
jgi:hypothetical protein